MILSLKLKIIIVLFIFGIFHHLPAHGPSRQKVVQKIEINGNLSDVWEIVSNFSDFTWSTMVSSSESDGNDIGAIRTVKSKNGSIFSQTLEKLNNEKKLISWRIKDTDQKLLPVNSYQATIVANENNGIVEVTYKAGFYRGFMGNDPPEELNDVNSKRKVYEFIDASLKSLKDKIEK